MKNRQITDAIAAAAKNDTPDVLESILRSCERVDRARKEGCDMTNMLTADTSAIMELPSEKQKPKRLLVKLVATAALLAIGFGTWFGLEYYTVDSVIDIDVNPSIELSINRLEKVLSVVPLNAEATAILDGMNLKNVDLDVAVNALIGSMLKNGYVSEMKNSILISIENADSTKGEDLQWRLSDEVSNLLDAYSVGGAVLSQTLSEDKRLQALAEEHHISLGKAALVDLLVSQDTRLTFADIAALPINDINLLIAGRLNDIQGVSSNGQASSRAYIGEEKAKSIALQEAGVSKSSVSYTKAKLDFDEGCMVYEVEFDTSDAEYDYEIDAVTGQVVGRDVDQKLIAAPSGVHETNDIGEAKAKSIVLAHAEIEESMVTFIKAELEHDDGRRVYDIEFLCGNIEYDYEVNAVTGEILAHDRDIEDYTASPHHSDDAKPPASQQSGTTPSPSPSPSPSGSGGIGASDAKSIALKEAGLKEAEVSHMRVKLEHDDGRKVFDVEFKNGSVEYEYEIDAATGKILERDSDNEH